MASRGRGVLISNEMGLFWRFFGTKKIALLVIQDNETKPSPEAIFTLNLHPVLVTLKPSHACPMKLNTPRHIPFIPSPRQSHDPKLLEVQCYIEGSSRASKNGVTTVCNGIVWFFVFVTISVLQVLVSPRHAVQGEQYRWLHNRCPTRRIWMTVNGSNVYLIEVFLK